MVRGRRMRRGHTVAGNERERRLTRGESGARVFIHHTHTLALSLLVVGCMEKAGQSSGIKKKSSWGARARAAQTKARAIRGGRGREGGRGAGGGRTRTPLSPPPPSSLTTGHARGRPPCLPPFSAQLTHTQPAPAGGGRSGARTTHTHHTHTHTLFFFYLPPRSERRTRAHTHTHTTAVERPTRRAHSSSTLPHTLRSRGS